MKQISIYQVDETPIGSGGMGRVLRGTDPQGRQIAIKEILPEFASDFEIRTRTEREVEMLQQLNNDSIVKVFDQFPLGDNFYIVMEYVDGYNIEQYVQKFGAIPWERATRFMVKILEAMQFVHEKNFVHRDMKPSNIMIRNDERICILDFGIAKDLGNKGGGTVVGTIIGSDGYMSPEQADGFDIDHRADIYALGCVFYYMLTGHHAYNTLASDYETRSNIANTPFPKLSKHSKKSFPPKLQEILDHATDKNMMRRYQSCREFRKDLESIYPSDTHIDSSKKDNIFITVGREGCDILIDDNLMKVSRSHLDIVYRQFTRGRYYVITDHSANGTLVNGRRLNRGDSENIPADGVFPKVYLACDSSYPLDWEKVKRLIAEKLKEASTIGQEGPVGETMFGPAIKLKEHVIHKTDISLVDAIKLLFKGAFDFNGRSRRKEFWYVVLFNFILCFSLILFPFLIALVISGFETAYIVFSVLYVFIWLYSIIIAIPMLALEVRRLHDIGKSGWWILITLIPIVGGIIMLVWMATDSESGYNDWGPCPK